MKNYQNLGRQSSPERYRDYGSLFFSMRSVYKNVKFAKKWFLVVESESQVPTFLNQSTFQESDGYHLEIIYHHQIFSSLSHYPTFNSATIESYLYRIPGLSECFIYLNDDFFIHRPVNQSFFVGGDGKPITYKSPNMVPSYCPWSFWTKQLKYTNILLNNHFNTPNKERNRVTHNTYFFKKSILKEIANVFF
ncbi:Capsular polysaccharide phosphotransferase [Entamoeba marina]